MNHRRKRPRYHQTGRSRASTWRYPKVPGDARQALASAVRRIRASVSDLREGVR